MKLFGGLSRRERLRSSSAVVAGVTIPAFLAVLALVHPGVKVAEVSLNDGAVWVTKGSELVLGRWDARLKALNGGLVANDAGFDVRQDAQDVLLVEPGKLSVVDPASMLLSAQAGIPVESEVSMAAGIVALTGADGEVWIQRMSSLATIELSTVPELDLAAGARAVVTNAGEVLAFDPADGTVRQADGSVHSDLDQAAGVIPDEMTVVGDAPVIRQGSVLHGDGWTTDLAALGSDPVLQLPSAEADYVTVATSTGVILVDLLDGSVEELLSGGTGKPTRPVSLGGCVFGAWASEQNNWLQRCADGAAVHQSLNTLTSASNPVFRVNRSVVVLNDTATGDIWSPDDLPAAQVPNWSEVEQNQAPDTREDDNTSDITSPAQTAECADQSAAPEARDDSLGVRPGRTTILAVLDNDAAGDCGIISISDLDLANVPETFGKIESIYAGQALQIVTAPDASGSVTLTYSITDGRGKNPPSTATVTLTVNDMSVNSEPVQLREGVTEVEQGASVEYNALANFIDPDGDNQALLEATAEGGVKVHARQDGIVTIKADAEALGRQVVSLVVSDGTHSVVGQMAVDVRPVGSLAPKVNPVHITTYAGKPVKVDVMSMVRSVSAEPARLASVEETAGTTIETDLEGGSFLFTAANAQTYYVPFTVIASPQSVRAFARIDVVDPPVQVQPPVAVRDTALLPALGEVIVAPLANDVDLAGNVLVLTSVTLSPDSGLQAAVVDHAFVRISSVRQLEAAEIIEYTISNGTLEAKGEILVVPVPAPSLQRPPQVEDIKVSVRTGGVVSIPVLDWATDPDSDTLELVPELPVPLQESQGLLFASGDQLRFQATQTPGTVETQFSVRDSAGNVTSGRLTITVHAANKETKSPPRPKSITARTFDGEKVRISVPLTGIDVDGDGVTLLGLGDSAPTMGFITSVGADYLEYEAFPGSAGTDTFTYAVEDWTGQRAQATIRVGVSARSAIAQPIIARDDEITVQPGKRVEYRVLRNDVDPFGGELTLSENLEIQGDISARVEGRRVIVDTPPTAGGTYSIVYTVTNQVGSRASATLTVRVVDDALILPPVARDITVAPIEVVDKTTVEVDVFELAENPSGPLSELALSVPATHAAVASVTSGNKVLVTLTDQSQTIPYLLTNTNPDAKGVRAYAFIIVPAIGDFPPMLRPKTTELRVASGAELTISLAEYVQVGTGKKVRLTEHDKVSATRSDGSELVVDQGTLRYVSAAGYAGPASITFEVTDGAVGTEGRRKTLTLPITVYAEDDYPPTFNAGTVEVPQGETMTVDLLPFTRGPEGAVSDPKYTYTIASQPLHGFVAAIDGTKLVVSVPADASAGTLGSVPIILGYGSATKDVKVDLKVTASSRPLARILDHQRDGRPEKEIRIDVLEGSFNPFSEPLTVLSATVETPGAGTAKVSGDSVLVRPGASLVGTMTVRYRVRDATGDPRRDVDARIQVIVKDVPDAPAAPRIAEESAQTVKLSWDAPTANGSPITGYRVTRFPSGKTTSCLTTACTITGLTNGTDYTFTVAAENAIGWSPESPSSAPARPDVVPDTPAAPTLTAGDTTVQVSWAAPANQGSPITQYTVELDGQTQVVSGLTAQFTGLVNGTGYTARVRAHSAATPAEGGTWSEWSAVAIPAGVPAAPTSVSAVRVDDALGRQLRVTWDAAGSNGSPLTGYSIIGTSPGRADLVGSTGGDTTSIQFSNAINGALYTFSVRAINSVGTGEPGESNSTYTYTSPGVPGGVATSVTVNRDFGDGQVVYSWTAPADAGGEGLSIESYLIKVGDLEYVVNGTSYPVSGLSAGPAPTASVRAVSSSGALSAWVALPDATVMTKPGGPNVLFGGADALSSSLRVDWNVANNGGSAITSYRYQLDEQPVETVGPDIVSISVVNTTNTVKVWAGNDNGYSVLGEIDLRPFH